MVGLVLDWLLLVIANVRAHLDSCLPDPRAATSSAATSTHRQLKSSLIDDVLLSFCHISQSNAIYSSVFPFLTPMNLWVFVICEAPNKSKTITC